MLCYLYNTGLLFKLTHKTINSMKKLCLLLLPFFYIGLGSGIRDPGSGIRDPRSGIRDPGSGMNKYSDPDPGSGIKHPGSATLESTKHKIKTLNENTIYTVEPSVSDLDPLWIRIRWSPGSGSALRMRIRIQKWENQKKK
jgi:hypothetical protein